MNGVSEKSNVGAVCVFQTQAMQKPDGFMDRMAQIMAEEPVKNFFRDYFSTWSDARAALMLLQTYIVIDDEYRRQTNGKSMPSDEIAAIVREMVRDSECRKLLVDAMTQFSNGNEQKFLSAYRRISPTLLLPPSTAAEETVNK